MLDKAIAIASYYHQGQYDKQGQPYILHPLQVMKNLNTSDQELMCIAVLHDTIEDTALTITELFKHGFSNRVLSGVELLTHSENDSYDEYLSKILISEDAIRVKMADIEHNSLITRLIGTTEKDIKRLEKYAKAYEKLKNTLEGNGI